MLVSSTVKMTANGQARMLLPFMNTSDNSCLQLFYQMRSSSLTVKILYPGEVEQEIVLRTTSSLISDWEKIVRILPKESYYRILIEATLTNTAEATSFVAIDDISVFSCNADTLGKMKLAFLSIIKSLHSFITN